jgi:hypothetical protein
MLQITARLRGLEPRTPIQKGIKTRAEITQYLNELMNQRYTLEELQLERTVLSELGLIPPELDYREFLLKLLAEQAGGCYDPAKKVLYIASWLPEEMQKPVMVHELTHALQDQHFNLDQILKDLRKLHNDDQALAQESVIEGDGAAVMINYILEPMNRNFASIPDLAFVLRSTSGSTEAQSPLFRSAPLFIQESLLFPYGYGAAFLQKVWAKNPSWDTVNKLYSDLPLSTEQILHPEKYLESRDNPKPVDVGDPAGRLGDNWKVAYKNVFGEFSLGLLLRLYLPEGRAEKAAAGWGGDRVLLLENGAGKRGVLIETVWDSSQDADEFYEALGDWFAKRDPAVQKTGQSPDGYSVMRDGKLDAVRRDGSRVLLIIGFPEAEGLKLMLSSRAG